MVNNHKDYETVRVLLNHAAATAQYVNGTRSCKILLKNEGIEKRVILIMNDFFPISS